MHWTIADGLGLIPMDGPETCHHTFDLPRRGWLPRFGTPRGIIWMGTWRTLHTRLILHAPGAISVHGDVSQVSLKLGPSDPELSALLTAKL